MSGRFELVTSPWATAGLVLCCQEVHLSMGSKPGWMLLLSTQPWSSDPFCSQRSTQAASSSSTSWKVSRTHHTWAKYEPDSLFFILLLVSDFQSTTLCSHVNYFSWSGKYICTGPSRHKPGPVRKYQVGPTYWTSKSIFCLLGPV